MSRSASPDFAAGMGLALAELHRLHGDSSGVCEVARAAGLGLAELRAAGLEAYDTDELARAGVPEGDARPGRLTAVAAMLTGRTSTPTERAVIVFARQLGRARTEPPIYPPHAALLVVVPYHLDPVEPHHATAIRAFGVGTAAAANLARRDWLVLPHVGDGRTPTEAQVRETAARWARLLGVPVVDP